VGYSKNKASHALLKKCDFDDKSEINFIEKVSNLNSIFLMDCGCNYGFYSLYTASLSKKNKVIAIDASKKTCQAFKKNKDINNFLNIEIQNIALSDKDDQEAEFLESVNDWESSLTHNNFHNANSLRIKTKKIDSLIQSSNYDNEILIIKLDIEGNEFKALEGATNTISQFEPIIIIEFSKFIFSNLTSKNFLKNFLITNDYSIYDMRKKKVSAERIFKLIENLDQEHDMIGNYFLIKNNSQVLNILTEN